MEQAFHTTHIDNDDDQILIASWNPTRNAPYHRYRLVVPEYVKTRKTDLINNEIRDSCNKSGLTTESRIPLISEQKTDAKVVGTGYGYDESQPVH